MGRLRIAVVTPELPNREYPNRGRSVYQTLLHLREYADLQAFCPLPRYPAHFLPRFDYRRSDLSYSLPGIPAIYFEYPTFPVVTRPINGLTCARRLEPLIRKFQPDVILNFLLYPAGYAAVQVGGKLHVPVVVSSIGSDLNNIPDPISAWLTRKTLTGATRIIAKSKQLRDRMIAMGATPAKTEVVTNGCDADLFFVRDRNVARNQLGIPLSTELILFVGRLNRAKGVHELLDTVALLKQKRVDMKLVFLGDGPERESLKEKVRIKNLGACTEFLGECTPPKVADWLAASNLLVLPSYAEGCPNVVIEALSCGRPVVATCVGALPDLVDRMSGILAPVRNIQALTNALDAALDSVWNEQLIARRSRRTWQEVAVEFFSICEGTQAAPTHRIRMEVAAD
jgi:teichuronic acid biosynthesis glycosyltransferase TuaC